MSIVLPLLLAVSGTLTTNDVPVSTNASAVGSTRITAASTYYDRKEGFVCFNGNVAVVDAQYQLHADRAFVLMGETNSLKRIVAFGHVAITNETKRAYGAKASYYRDTGMVMLYSDGKTAAEVRDETPDGDQVVRGRKIKFWTGSRQVEVLEADISAPAGGGMMDSIKGFFGR